MSRHNLHQGGRRSIYDRLSVSSSRMKDVENQNSQFRRSTLDRSLDMDFDNSPSDGMSLTDFDKLISGETFSPGRSVPTFTPYYQCSEYVPVKERLGPPAHSLVLSSSGRKPEIGSQRGKNKYTWYLHRVANAQKKAKNTATYSCFVCGLGRMIGLQPYDSHLGGTKHQAVVEAYMESMEAWEETDFFTKQIAKAQKIIKENELDTPEERLNKLTPYLDLLDLYETEKNNFSRTCCETSFNDRNEWLDHRLNIIHAQPSVEDEDISDITYLEDSLMARQYLQSKANRIAKTLLLQRHKKNMETDVQPDTPVPKYDPKKPTGLHAIDIGMNLACRLCPLTSIEIPESSYKEGVLGCIHKQRHHTEVLREVFGSIFVGKDWDVNEYIALKARRDNSAEDILVEKIKNAIGAAKQDPKRKVQKGTVGNSVDDTVWEFCSNATLAELSQFVCPEISDETEVDEERKQSLSDVWQDFMGDVWEQGQQRNYDNRSMARSFKDGVKGSVGDRLLDADGKPFNSTKNSRYDDNSSDLFIGKTRKSAVKNRLRLPVQSPPATLDKEVEEKREKAMEILKQAMISKWASDYEQMGTSKEAEGLAGASAMGEDGDNSEIKSYVPEVIMAKVRGIPQKKENKEDVKKDQPIAGKDNTPVGNDATGIIEDQQGDGAAQNSEKDNAGEISPEDSSQSITTEDARDNGGPGAKCKTALPEAQPPDEAGSLTGQPDAGGDDSPIKVGISQSTDEITVGTVTPKTTDDGKEGAQTARQTLAETSLSKETEPCAEPRKTRRRAAPVQPVLPYDGRKNKRRRPSKPPLQETLPSQQTSAVNAKKSNTRSRRGRRGQRRRASSRRGRPLLKKQQDSFDETVDMELLEEVGETIDDLDSLVSVVPGGKGSKKKGIVDDEDDVDFDDELEALEKEMDDAYNDPDIKGEQESGTVNDDALDLDNDEALDYEYI